MEVINNFVATVYHRYNLTDSNEIIEGSIGAEPEGQAIRWKPKYRIKRFPTTLGSMTSVPYLFSPNFKYLLDFSYSDEEFMIRETEGLLLYVRIPKDFITTRWHGRGGWKAIKIIASRFRWVTERVFRFINESNLDCLIEICTTDPDDLDINCRYFKLLSSVKVDNL